MEYLTSVTPIAATLSKEQLKVLASCVQNITNIAIKLIEENAYLRGRLNEQALQPTMTHADALQQKSKNMTNQQNNENETDTLESRRSRPEKAALLVFPKTPKVEKKWFRY